MKNSFLIMIFLFGAFCSFAQSISNVELNKFHFKLGENFAVSIRTNGTFQSGNIFRVEISDRDGNFAYSTIIGSIQAQTDVVIPCRIPDTLQLGINYRLRVSATLPYYSSSPISQNIIIYRGALFYVSPLGSDSSDGSKNNPFKTIQRGIDLAWFFDTIFVFPGTYYENIVFKGIPISLIGIKGYDSTIIDGRNNGRPVISIESGENINTLIDGFTIQNGRTYEMEQGGGMTIRYSSTNLTLSNLRFRNNNALSYGGGLYCFSAGPINIRNCIFENNVARYFGAGIYAHLCDLNLESCIIGKNNPGAIMAYRSNLILKNSLIFKNNSHEVMVVSELGEQLYPRVINSTIYAQPGFYAYYLEGRFIAGIYNSIIFGKDSTIFVSGDAYDTLYFDYNIIFNYPKGFRSKLVSIRSGRNNLSDDPLFIAPSDDNFDLDTCSPALGSASKEFAPPFDLFGNQRPIAPEDDELPDRGAIESPRSQRSNVVNIASVSKTLFCESEKFNVDYQTGGCPFYDGNEFFVELSNKTGTFNPSTVIGSIKSSISGRIQCQIPPNLSPGSYKIRIRATMLPYRSNPFPQPIQVFGNPSANIFGETKVCSKREYIYWTDSSDNPTNRWSIVNGISYNLLTENSIKVIWKDSANGKISLSQINPAGCSGSSSKDITIFVTPEKPTIQQIQGGNLVSSYPSWNQWYWNGNPIPNANGRIYTPTKNGYYSVKVVPPYGCPSDMSDSIFVLVSDVPNDNSKDISVSYLEKFDLIRINNLQNIHILRLSLFDVYGNEVLNAYSETFDNSIEIATKSLSNGIYFLVISTIYDNLTFRLLIYK